jgi:pimeloyl-ACP methyl ester carboxylesterase
MICFFNRRVRGGHGEKTNTLRSPRPLRCNFLAQAEECPLSVSPTFPIPYHDFGGHGRVLHFAHANAYPPGAYRQFLEPLTEQFHVLAMALRPLWPGSDPSELTSWELIADDLITFLDQQNLRGVIGVGHSLGGVATMVAAVKRPELFTAVVLIDPVFLEPRWLEAAKGATLEERMHFPMVQAAVRRRDVWADEAEVFARYRPKQVFAGLSDEVLWDFVRAGTRPCDPSPSNPSQGVTLTYPKLWEAQIYATLPHIWESLPHLTHPLLAIRAANSDTLSPKAWQLWQNLLPQATYLEIPHVGHLLPLEIPQPLAAELLTFCQPWA